MLNRQNIFSAILTAGFCIGALTPARGISVSVDVSSRPAETALSVSVSGIYHGDYSYYGSSRTTAYSTARGYLPSAYSRPSSRSYGTGPAVQVVTRNLPMDSAPKEILRVTSAGEQRYQVDREGRIIQPAPAPSAAPSSRPARSTAADSPSR